MGPPSRPDRRELRREGSSPDVTRDAGFTLNRASVRRVLDTMPEEHRLRMVEEFSLDTMDAQERQIEAIGTVKTALGDVKDELAGLREDFKELRDDLRESRKATRSRPYTAKELATLIAASAAALAAVSTSIGMLLHH